MKYQATPPKNNQKAQGQYLELLNEFIAVK